MRRRPDGRSRDCRRTGFDCDMFSLISRLVTRRPGLVVLTCVGLAALLWYVAPRWDDVTKDDNVRFFPHGFPSVVGQELLDRGFPRDAASSQVVLACERNDGPLKLQDYRYVEPMAGPVLPVRPGYPGAGGGQALQEARHPPHPRDRPEALGGDGGGPGRPVLTIVSLNGTYLAKTTRLAVDAILEWARAGTCPPPRGAATGRDRLGGRRPRHQHRGQREHRQHHLDDDHPGGHHPADRLPVAAAGDGPAGDDRARSVVVSLRAMALLTTAPGFGFQVINITKVFVVVVLFGAGTDYCLFLIARYREELATRPDRGSRRCARRSSRSAAPWWPRPGR